MSKRSGSAIWVVVFALVVFSVGMTTMAVSSLLDGRASADAAERLRARVAACLLVAPASSVGTRAGKPNAPGIVDPKARMQHFEQGILLPRNVRLTASKSDAQEQFVTLADVLPARTVGVMNLWAPSCEPCNREFPLLRRLVPGSRKEVVFLPVLVGEEVARPEEYRKKMPPFGWFLLDQDPGRGLVPALQVEGLYRDGPPVTFILDCHGAVRWVHFGEIHEADEASFNESLSIVTSELTTAKCTPLDDGQPPPRQTPKGSSSRPNGDTE